MICYLKYLLLGITVLLLSCKSVDKVHEPIIINSILDSKIEEEFRKKDLKKIYPKLLTPENFDTKCDTLIVNTIKGFQNKLINRLQSKKINWKVQNPEIQFFTRIYFDSIGQIEYFAFKINNDSVKLKAIKEFKSLLAASIKDLKLDIENDTKYNHCVNFKLSNEN